MPGDVDGAGAGADGDDFHPRDRADLFDHHFALDDRAALDDDLFTLDDPRGVASRRRQREHRNQQHSLHIPLL
jgi:hypothetical protein